MLTSPKSAYASMNVVIAYDLIEAARFAAGGLKLLGALTAIA